MRHRSDDEQEGENRRDRKERKKQDIEEVQEGGGTGGRRNRREEEREGGGTGGRGNRRMTRPLVLSSCFFPRPPPCLPPLMVLLFQLRWWSQGVAAERTKCVAVGLQV